MLSKACIVCGKMVKVKAANSKHDVACGERCLNMLLTKMAGVEKV